MSLFRNGLARLVWHLSHCLKMSQGCVFCGCESSPWAMVSVFRQLCQRDPAFYWLWPHCPLKIVFKLIIFLNKLTWHKSSSYARPPASNLAFCLLYVSSPLFFLTGSFMWPPCGKWDKEKYLRNFITSMCYSTSLFWVWQGLTHQSLSFSPFIDGHYFTLIKKSSLSIH